MRRMTLVLAGLSLLAFRSLDQHRVHPMSVAGPRLSMSRVFHELDTDAKYFAPRNAPPRAEAWSQPSNVAKLLQPIRNARLVLDKGQALTDVLAGLPEERRVHGVAGLTPNQLGPLCEQPELEFEVDHDGERYEARYIIESTLWMTEPVPSLYALSSTCTDALLATNGAVEDAVGAGCAREDEEAHFPPNGTCRACLTADGDHARCVAAGECKTEMAREIFAEGAYHDILEAKSLACAPNYLSDVIFLAGELGENNIAPQAFVHGPISQACEWFWQAGTEELKLYCFDIDPFIPLAFGDLVLARVTHIRKPGATDRPHAGRLIMASGAELDGLNFRAVVLGPGTLGPISFPNRDYGFAWNPAFLRPDGDDPNNVDHTFARDWIAAVTVKTATQITGVPVSYRNRNLCTEDQWRGPDDKGRYYCKQPYFPPDSEGPPDHDQWAYDEQAFYYSYDPVDLEIRPMTTLAATGLMAPNIPGGHVSQMYGSSQLADPDWDNCAWPETFEPDEMLTLGATDENYTHTSQTYRYSKDPERKVRVTLGTSWRRGFCPGPVTDR